MIRRHLLLAALLLARAGPRTGRTGPARPRRPRRLPAARGLRRHAGRPAFVQQMQWLDRRHRPDSPSTASSCSPTPTRPRTARCASACARAASASCSSTSTAVSPAAARPDHGARAHQPHRPHALAAPGDRLAPALTAHSNSMITSSTARLSPGAAWIFATRPCARRAARSPSSSPRPWRAAARRGPRRPRPTSTRTTSPGIGQSSSFEVSGGSFSGISAASSACRGDSTFTAEIRAAQPHAPAVGDPLDLDHAGARRRPRPRQRLRPAPSPTPPASRAVLEPDRAPDRSASIVTGNAAPCSFTTQAAPTLRWWLSIAPRNPRPRGSRRPGASPPPPPRPGAASARRSVTPSNPSGYSSAMKAVVIRPSTKRGWSITADQERQVVPDPLDLELVERRAHRRDRPGAVRRPGAELGDHRIVEHARSRRPRRPRCRCAPHARASAAPRAAGSASAARSTAGSCDRDPRHKAGSRSPSRSSVTSSWPNASCSPAATRIICSTRSMPVTSSVTGCSTCKPRIHFEEVEVAAAVDDELHRAGRA